MDVWVAASVEHYTLKLCLPPLILTTRRTVINITVTVFALVRLCTQVDMMLVGRQPALRESFMLTNEPGDNFQ